MTEITILGLIPEYCALFLLLVIMFINQRKNDARKITDSRQKLINHDFINCELITLAIIVVDTVRYSVHSPTVEYLTAMIFHCSVVVVANCITTYIYDILPSLKEKSMTFYKIKGKITLAVVCIMALLSPTGLIYGLVDGNVVAGKLCFISYIVGASLFVICMFGAYKSNVSRKIRHTLYVIIICTVVPGSFEFIFRSTVTSGIGFVAGLIMLSGMFHDGVFDMTHGTESFANIGGHLAKNSKVLVFDIKPNKELRHNQIDEDIHKVLMTIKEKFGCYTLYESNGRYALIIKVKYINDVSSIWNDIVYKYNNEFDIYSLIVDKSYISNVNMSVLSDVELSNELRAFNDNDVNKIERRKMIKNTILSIVGNDNYFDKRLVTVVQPIKDITINKFLTSEMLTRLRVDGIDGLVMPYEFIPIVEELKCVHKFNLCILDNACRLMKQIRANRIEFNSISVNFDPSELVDKSFVSDVSSIVYNNGIRPKCIHIEITESSELEDSEKTRSCITDLLNLGFEVYLDDFGTKYSNIVELLSSKFNVIKIDRQLILKALEDEAAYKVVTALSSACSAVGYKVLFEGVDSDDGIKLARDNDATYIQGFYYSEPLEWNDFMEFIKNENQAQLKVVK
jgi:EAL domain-containing protein (putative c-di-GMP-specific phosphodiesterase class I)